MIVCDRSRSDTPRPLPSSYLDIQHSRHCLASLAILSYSAMAASPLHAKTGSIINACTSVSMTTSRCKCGAHTKTHINGEKECHRAQLQEEHVTCEDKDRFFFSLITRLFCFPQITRVTIKSHARSRSGKHAHMQKSKN